MSYLSLSSKEEFKEQLRSNFLLSTIISRHILRMESTPIMSNEASRERTLLRVFGLPKSKAYSQAAPANIYAFRWAPPPPREKTLKETV